MRDPDDTIPACDRHIHIYTDRVDRHRVRTSTALFYSAVRQKVSESNMACACAVHVCDTRGDRRRDRLRRRSRR